MTKLAMLKMIRELAQRGSTANPPIEQSLAFMELNNMINVEESNERIKENLLATVRFHKAKCHDSECGVSMYHLRQLAQLAGIELSDEEKGMFS